MTALHLHRRRLVAGAIVAAAMISSAAPVSASESAAPPTPSDELAEIEPFVDGNDPIPTADVAIEYWDDRWGQSLADIANGVEPDRTVDHVGGFDAASDVGDSYGIRMRAILTPTETATYRFHIAGDDDVRLFVNPNHTEPGGARLAAYIAGWTDRYQWDRFKSQRSRWFELEAGGSYYLELIGKEGSGGDHFSLGWQQRGTKRIDVVPAEVLEATELGSGGWRTRTPIGLPGRPAPFTDPRFAATSGPQSLDVSWASVAGAEFYRVRLEGAGEQRKVTVESPAVDFDGLVPGTRYLIEVRPGNAAKIQPPATAVFVTDEGAYPTPVSPVEGDRPTVVYERWDTGWWTLTSVPDGAMPDSRSTLSWGFESPPMQGENHATRLRALVTPTESGEYTLFVSGDDDARLLFNHKNHRADRARPAAYVAGWTEQYQWERYQSQRSRPYALRAGTSYYIEAIGVHALGLDHLEVGWSFEGGPIEVIPAEVLAPTLTGSGGWRQLAAERVRRPGRPNDLTATATETTVSATWSAPTVTPKRGPAEYYVVELRRKKAVLATATVDDPSVTFDGLEPGVRYKIRVRAWNAGNRGGVRSSSARTSRPAPEPVDYDVDGDGTPDDEQPLYRVRVGDPDRGEKATRYYIERSVAAAEAQLGVSDWDGDGDGWSSYARTNGSGEWGELIDLVVLERIPLLVVDHPRNGCRVFTPKHTDTVKVGQTRIVVAADDQSLCDDVISAA